MATGDNHAGKVRQMPHIATDTEGLPIPDRRLTMAERLAVELVQQRMSQAQAQMRSLLESMGLDPDKSWRMTPEGVITPA